jgi:hypothetical protein
LAVPTLFAGVSAATAADIRFQVPTSPIVVIDTQTSALWTAESDGRGKL